MSFLTNGATNIPCAGKMVAARASQLATRICPGFTTKLTSRESQRLLMESLVEKGHQSQKMNRKESFAPS